MSDINSINSNNSPLGARGIMFQNRLLKVYKHLSKLARRQSISCYRIYDKDLPEFPLIIDVYADKIYLAEYRAKHNLTEEEHELWLNESLRIVSEVTNVPDEKIYLKERKRKTERTDQYQKTAEENDFFIVEESGLKFKVNLTDYLDTGLFLDHRITRQMVKEQCNGKHVLNLFAYTGSFSVYAAAGNAASVTTVDLSKTYLQWAEDNFKLNEFTNKYKYQFIHADVKQYLKTLKPDSFDIVIMDPPTFSNSKRMKDFLDIQQDHVELINDVLNALTKDGVLYFSTNYTKFILDAENIKATAVKDITKATTPFDFEGKLKRWCYLIRK
jgi:23S rRNA (cytosine1962-C5)-methyltransferase